MVALIIAAHGELAPALLASTQMIMGPLDNVEAVDFTKSEGPDDLLAKYEDAYKRVGPDVLFLVDLFGGSPFNAAARFAAVHPGVDVVTGVSLPMLIEVSAGMNGADVPTLVKAAIAAGGSGIRTYSQMQTTVSTADEEGDEL
ncbi:MULTISPECIES: PTS sugar transporter subunit IIA [Bifidobacterium]|jgi:PTS system mannose-specific IIB component|uniref:PTS sugar transporter subunit IIA n=1 Tax=Bifidobacterium tibiigranuli TaxID=2172043 RepID=A0A5N6RY27_9BIFI|nr:PTS sugar transporter subunit IIA [Bifidobacterium tibiigranuli]KAE8127242.1 PTS mannose transporter subunit IID [Bifidobacterium tibiigranuli]KAE8129633.1 PTS sugar transporter subunit IIA [Bifidobacterium tibiigranuli]MCH3975639.1 PTS sugar transporter subunit IIA [Bifidobacterium tibiigranuli]MCH4189594.1 PTS sugar transporter subunit IIA [Bifidobacterium tibiigranuli]MCH4204427.1 PTS sugar transporter subunit IIA [Bifidobacterium tibiigranuli]